ncbi:hypothetical protein A3Q56_00054 [Intoshia linei]|uniref:Uncharacterized protein n=1 Tax=Intoshia linei TaxID=1819745 RepID=A0A177BFB0_9BILA|nr:hypothetical protein A3Q56_00054 [Intoshia linei]
MGRGTKLTKEEQTSIEIMYNDGYTPLEVRRKIINGNPPKKRGYKVENNTDYNKNMSNCGKTSKIDSKMIKSVTASLCGISKTSVWNILKKETTIRYRSLMKKSNLNQKHKEARVKYIK